MVSYDPYTENFQPCGSTSCASGSTIATTEVQSTHNPPNDEHFNETLTTPPSDFDSTDHSAPCPGWFNHPWNVNHSSNFDGKQTGAEGVLWSTLEASPPTCSCQRNQHTSLVDTKKSKTSSATTPEQLEHSDRSAVTTDNTRLSEDQEWSEMCTMHTPTSTITSSSVGDGYQDIQRLPGERQHPFSTPLSPCSAIIERSIV
jgi:hypothetical protein